MKINILGASFAIRTDEEQSYLNKVVDYYETQVEKIMNSTGAGDKLITAILAGILTADELHKCREYNEHSKELENISENASQIAASLITSIDESIDESTEKHDYKDIEIE